MKGKTVIKPMKHKIATYIPLSLVTALMLYSCQDDDSFTLSTANRLTFSTDTVRIDTIFSTVPSSTRSFWIYNKSGDGIRCTTIRLEKGNQAGFRANVDGAYLSPAAGYQVHDIEIRDKDSIRVFVEATTARNNADTPQMVEDNLIFSLESGVQQKVNLNAFSWDATLVKDMKVDKDTTIKSSRPIVVYGMIEVASNATLTIAPGTTLYFHQNSGINVEGRLIAEGTPQANITFRGDRLDRMFDYLPYDNVSGQWQGIHLKSQSYGNKIAFADIHGTYNGLLADSSNVENLKLELQSCTIHNCQGAGLAATNSYVKATNCQITNTLGDCLFADGGKMEINNCTLAQFYPFDSNRGQAIRFSSLEHPLIAMSCSNSLITGYSDDVMSGQHNEKEEDTFNYHFDHCIIRTPKIETEDSANFTNVVFEAVDDTTKAGEKNFVKIDNDNLTYDFRLKGTSLAIGAADPNTSDKYDRDGNKRDEKPDIGAYEYIEATKPEQNATTKTMLKQ